ncbi:hypothetical protein V5799_030791 [Amblyomma americanum]|uniref:Secreted protein n=1 Tax=Amblyomma americanum TaxID=6943 RepID=A0AAQ4EMB5_AMBAM
MEHVSRICFYAVTYACMLTLLEGAKFDECGQKPGVVTAAKAASMGASILAKCGRSLLLKYAIDTEVLSRVSSTRGAEHCWHDSHRGDHPALGVLGDLCNASTVQRLPRQSA